MLGLDGPAELRAVKKAYAIKLKSIDRNDPDQFQALRRAFDMAKKQATDAAAQTAKPDVRAMLEQKVALPPPQTPAQPKTPPIPRPAPPAQGARSAPAQTPKPAPSAVPRSGRSQHRSRPSPHQATNTKTPPKPNKVWGAQKPPNPPRPVVLGPGIAQLDALNTHDRRAAFASFQQHLAAAATWPWQTARLKELLALEMAEDLTVRQLVEHQLYQSLEDNLHRTQDAKGYPMGWPVDIAQFLEGTFDWQSDTVGLRRRVGHRPQMAQVMQAMHMAVPKHGESSLSLENRPYFIYRVIIAMLAGAILIGLGITNPVLILIFTLLGLFAGSVLAGLALDLLTQAVAKGIEPKWMHRTTRGPLKDWFASLARSKKYRKLWSTILGMAVFVVFAVRWAGQLS